jgi:hypothetical protein
MGKKVRIFVFAVLPILASPWLYTEWKTGTERNLLETTGQMAGGTVVRHTFRSKGCRSHLEAEFSVSGTKHIAIGTGISCSYDQRNSLLGRSIEVRYLPSAPEIAEVENLTLAIEGKRVSWWTVVLIVGVSLLFWLCAFVEWHAKGGPEERAAVPPETAKTTAVPEKALEVLVCPECRAMNRSVAACFRCGARLGAIPRFRNGSNA